MYCVLVIITHNCEALWYDHACKDPAFILKKYISSQISLVDLSVCGYLVLNSVLYCHNIIHPWPHGHLGLYIHSRIRKNSD